MRKVLNKNGKTSTPLQYIFQAAMGHCASLPADGKKESGSNNAQNSSSGKRGGYGRKNQRESRDSSYHNGRPMNNDERHGDGDVVMGDAYVPNPTGRSSRDVNKLVHVAKQGNDKFDQYMSEDNDKVGPGSQSTSSKTTRSSRSKIHCAPPREEVLPPPPLGAVRTRCYRLNLDAPVILSPTHDHLRPMPYEPPVHLLPQRSNSRQIMRSESNESVERNPTEVAVNTARIFRGITVDKNGTILSQNARATRSSRGKEKSKQAGASRQQEKINKAKDLVDETNGAGGKVCSLMLMILTLFIAMSTLCLTRI
jgi:hypothetical protein